MNNKTNGLFVQKIDTHEEAFNLMGELIDKAHTHAVFSPPVEKGEYTVITAAEVYAGIGYGYGSGGSVREHAEKGHTEDGGGGGGGGGGVQGRPVAAIIIGPQGVQVEPIVDATKITLTFLTAIGALLTLIAKWKKKG